MNSLTTHRATIAAALDTAGLPAYPTVPEALTPPAALVLPDEPYLTEDNATQCGDMTVNTRVVILGGRGTNAVMAEKLDGLIVTALGVLDTGAHTGITVAEPVEVEANGVVYLGTTIRFSTLTEIGVSA